MLGRPAGGKISGCAANDDVMERQVANDQARLGDRSWMDSQIEALLHQILHTIGYDHLDSRVWVMR